MEIRLAKSEELDQILEIYENARQYMGRMGNPHQWGDAKYPSEALLRQDLAQKRLYLCAENNEILGVFCYFYGEDPTYRVIEDGAWQNDQPYGVIHRIAVAKHNRGVASFCFSHCFSLCNNLKIDTHEDNLPMQRALLKNGFVRCGTIYLENGESRIAFQKTE
ncbi:MAG: GNAT family N-acetyltransferase [Clostridia bacterium]|nr:GNAT family N-acetyltransferase [Clostridia bacterium]